MTPKRDKRKKQQPPVKIPLPFDKAVEGLLAVRPPKKQIRKPAKKKPGG